MVHCRMGGYVDCITNSKTNDVGNVDSPFKLGDLPLETTFPGDGLIYEDRV